MANYNPNLAKVNRSYTFEELAAVFGVHKNTVSSWVKNGLPCLKERLRIPVKMNARSGNK
jgi:phage terminase Nu1 subunit (DNA packaging protein)